MSLLLSLAEDVEVVDSEGSISPAVLLLSDSSTEDSTEGDGEHEALLENDRFPCLRTFLGGNGRRTGAGRSLGDANLFPSVRDGRFVASPF